MLSPKGVFDYPARYWNFLTAEDDAEFEGQHFDRKEAGRPDETTGRVSSSELKNIRDRVKETISAFANSNNDGGVLVLGISKEGRIKGLNHLDDQQRTSLTGIDELLRCQASQVKLFDCQNEMGVPDQICLIYVPPSVHGICETPGRSPLAWMRRGPQNLPMDDTRREQLRRDKKITDYERSYCCQYNPDDVDQSVLREFRKALVSSGMPTDQSDEQLLYQIGALDRDSSGQYYFTNAGFLFFAANPQRLLSWAYVRLLRFEASSENIHQRGLPTLQRPFTGPITKQIRDMRTFFQESGIFKIYQKRNPDGGFMEEPEFPPIAIDEAIVNAVAHRDYAMKLPIECEYYKDTFIVRNPGHIQQRNSDVPEHFTLETFALVSTPRNPKLIEWLKFMKDQRGAAFVMALSEGTKRMSLEMQNLNLPSPAYQVEHAQTTLSLYSNASEREASLQSDVGAEVTEFVNLFPLNFFSQAGNKVAYNNLNFEYKGFNLTLRDALNANGWFVDRIRYGRLDAHRKNSAITTPPEVAGIVRFYPGYSFQLQRYWNRYYLCIEYTLQVLNVQRISQLISTFKANDFVNRPATAKVSGKGWVRGKIVSITDEWVQVDLYDFELTEQILNSDVIPDLPISFIERLLQHRGVAFDLYRFIKQHSLSVATGSARERAIKTEQTAVDISQKVFPLFFNGMRVLFEPEAAPLLRQSQSQEALRVYTLSEPSVEFSRHYESSDIRKGITEFGTYDNHPRDITLVPICTPELREKMTGLIERLKRGKYKYRGAERTFFARLNYSSVVTVPSPESTLAECKRLLGERPEWAGNENLDRLFLVYSPEAGYDADDENSPYYLVKRFLCEQGVPCQMVDKPTLDNPDWKDLNLGLNIAAKCGITPWVLPDAIPDADFFIGLSYTQSRRKNSERQMGYANVFNQYGRWQFYSGNTESFPYQERAQHFKSLIRETMTRLSLSETPHIYFHYSAKFSHEDRQAILSAARSVRPQGIYSFVWINPYTNIRLYDRRPETDGSLSRGSYVTARNDRIYLSTTGYNPYRKALGTPTPLEITIQTETPKGSPRAEPDLRSLAVQILSLTKLNWASTDSLCGEPITTKYAGDIAYLTAAFLRQSPSFHLHKVLEKTPWFI